MATPKKTGASKRAKAPRLGRGLSSLMGTPVAVEPAAPAAPAPPPATPSPAAAGSSTPATPLAAPPATATATDPPVASPAEGLQHLPVATIVANRHQPRQHFETSALESLAASIRSEGIMQPIVVRDAGKGGYEIVAGERRWRAAQLAGLKTVPALVRELTDQQLAEWALIENVQREDLNPIERATAFQSLSDTFGLSQADVAERVGLDRSTVTNLLRLLKLAPAVQELVSRGTLSMSQARTIAGIADHDQQTVLAETAIKKSWSVRETEDAVRQANAAADTDPAAPAKAAPQRVAYLLDLERQIAEQLKTKVKLKAGRKKGSGTIAIDFYSIDEFDQLMSRLGVSTD